MSPTPWPRLATHRAWLDDECRRLLAFGARAVHPQGGAAWLDDDGRPDLSRPVHTWITARTAHVHALGTLLGVPGSAPLADAALAGLTGRLHDDEHGGWHSSVGADEQPTEGKECYAHAFVVLAAASCAVAGRPGAEQLLQDALDVVDGRFWDDDAGLCVDRWDSAWTRLDPYRGLNANMHAVEAMLAAADARGDDRWRRRAARTAGRVVAWGEQHGWRLPEHFDAAWAPQLEHSADRPDDPFQPYGATVGHALEWSRLLLQLEAALGTDASPALAPTAQELFARAVDDGWSADGADGFVYTTDWTGRPVVHDRMHWVVAEAIGAAAALHRRTGDDAYAAHYARWWDYAAVHLLDHERGSWRHQLDRHNRPTGTVWSGKPDLYHAVQATLLPQLPLTPSLARALAARR